MSYDPYTQVTTKTAELKDCLGNLRFKVVLEDVCEPTRFDTIYNVSVYSYCIVGEEEPTILVSEQFYEYDDAVNAFNTCVRRYRVLINAETKGWQDISVFNDKIHYHIIDADCCKNCKWSRLVTKDDCLFADWKKQKQRYRCCNPAIVKVQKQIDPHDPRTHLPPHVSDISERVTVQFDLAPIVQEDGICDDYVRTFDEKYRTAGRSEADWIKHTTETETGRVDAQVQYELNQQIDAKLKNIRIEKIIGNDNDANQNSIDDSKENQWTTIIGNLGA